MTRRDDMATSVEVEAALGKGKGKEGHNVGWADANLTESKNEPNSSATIGR
jgi:hypothetical protein